MNAVSIAAALQRELTSRTLPVCDRPQVVDQLSAVVEWTHPAGEPSARLHLDRATLEDASFDHPRSSGHQEYLPEDLRTRWRAESGARYDIYVRAFRLALWQKPDGSIETPDDAVHRIVEDLTFALCVRTLHSSERPTSTDFFGWDLEALRLPDLSDGESNWERLERIRQTYESFARGESGVARWLVGETLRGELRRLSRLENPERRLSEWTELLVSWTSSSDAATRILAVRTLAGSRLDVLPPTEREVINASLETLVEVLSDSSDEADSSLRFDAEHLAMHLVDRNYGPNVGPFSTTRKGYVTETHEVTLRTLDREYVDLFSCEVPGARDRYLSHGRATLDHWILSQELQPPRIAMPQPRLDSDERIQEITWHGVRDRIGQLFSREIAEFKALPSFWVTDLDVETFESRILRGDATVQRDVLTALSSSSTIWNRRALEVAGHFKDRPTFDAATWLLTDDCSHQSATELLVDVVTAPGEGHSWWKVAHPEFHLGYYLPLRRHEMLNISSLMRAHAEQSGLAGFADVDR